MKINLFDRRRVYGMSPGESTGVDGRSCGREKMTGTPENAAFSGVDAASRPRRGVLAAAIGTAALAGLLFGFDTAVIAGVTGDLTALFALTPETLGITVSAALWGTLVGALFAGKPGDAFGSRDSLRVLALLYFVAGLGCALRSEEHTSELPSIMRI